MNFYSILTYFTICYILYVLVVFTFSYRREHKLHKLTTSISSMKNIFEKEDYEMENKLTLEESITPLTEEEKELAIKEFSETLCKMAKKLYESYNVLRQDPVDETQKLDGHLMVFQSRLNDSLTGDLHDKLFKLAFDKRLNIFEVNKQFKKDVQSGKAIDLGKVVITDTAISNILSSNELGFSISFMLQEDWEEKERIRKEEEEKLKEE